VAFNLSARVCDRGIVVGDLCSAVIERRDLSSVGERRRQYARGRQRGRHRLMQTQSENPGVLNHICTSVTSLETDMKQQATSVYRVRVQHSTLSTGFLPL